ncbi:hypothetical protein [Salinibacterium sp. ZJ450]|uniref:hypothetical protein n=1 Tax=Salinibacterium sp. ZJ450 TaxID=2708338 RepID=UPI001CD4EBF7|nr:hypothetical protein [Salinibacterium sp. ZJ450]
MADAAERTGAAPTKPTAPTALRGVLVVVAGILLAAWVVAGRFLFGAGGDLTPLYLLLGILIVVLHAFIGLALLKTAQGGHRTRGSTVGTLVGAWVCGILLGLTIPDITPIGLQTVITGVTEPGRGIAIGLANPAGIIMIALMIASLVLANQDARGPRPSDDDAD